MPEQQWQIELERRAIHYHAKRWFRHRAFWIFWLLPATNAITGFVFSALPPEQRFSAFLVLQLAAIALGLVVKLMIANPPGGRG